MATTDFTELALSIRNDMDYGDYTNAEILEWNDEQLEKFCGEYIRSFTDNI